MRNIKLLIAALMLSSSAYAGLYLEPYVGYEKGDVTGTANGPFDQDVSGTQFGAKVGFNTMGFAVGVDGAQVSLAGEDNLANPDDMDFKGTDLGAFVQFTFPVMFKVSASYIFSSKAEDDTNVNGVKTKIEGKGFKFGVGFTGLPFVSINLDMINVNYDDITYGGTAITDADLDRKTFMLSLSLPLSF